jgi:stearoyl-CoA desaturase (delta-9 desaturase)
VPCSSGASSWHNHHHAQPRCAAHGHKWWEIDVTWRTIWLLQKLGLAWDGVPINKNLAAKLTHSAKDHQ